jgi:HEAT repeat protein
MMDGNPMPHGDEELRYRAVLALDPADPAALEPLLAALDDPSWRVQSAAAGRIAALADPLPALPALLGALVPGTSPGRANGAASALVAIGPPALSALCSALSGGAAETRVVAAEIVGEIGDRRAVGPLAGRLGDPDPNVRAAAAEALGKLGGADAAAALLRVLSSDDSGVRRSAMDALARLHTAPRVALLRELAADRALRRPALRLAGFAAEPAALELLIDGLSDASRATREAALAGLGQQRFRRAPSFAAAAERVRALVAADPGLLRLALAALAGDDAPLKVGAISVLEWAGGPEHAPALARAAEDERVRGIAADALQALGPGITLALQPLLGQLTPGSRAAALAALARMGDQSVLPLLCEDAAASDDGVRAAAVEGLVALADPRAVRWLAALLEHRDPEVAAGAVSALERLAAAGERSRAAALAACRRDGQLGASRCRLLGRLGGAGDAPALRRALGEADPAARVAAAGALAALSARGLLPPRPGELLDALDDLEPAVRAAAAEALGTIARGAAAWPEATRGLAVALRDEDAAVQAAAAAALGRAGAREYAGPLAQLAVDAGAAPQCAAAAVAALAELGDPDPAILERAARHADPEVVKEAVSAAARIPGPAGAGLLLTAATHPRWDVRRAAARAIGGRGDPSLLEPTRRLGAAENDPLVAEALAEAVRLLSPGTR